MFTMFLKSRAGVILCLYSSYLGTFQGVGMGVGTFCCWARDAWHGHCLPFTC